jgi:CHAT domain-containing protein
MVRSRRIPRGEVRAVAALCLPWCFAAAAAGAQTRAPLLEEVERLEAEGDVAGALQRLGTVEALPEPDRLRGARLEHRLLHALGRHAGAQNAGLRWIALAGEAGSASEQIDAHAATGRSFLAQDRQRDAAPHLRRALELLRGTGAADPEREVELSLDLVRALAFLGEYLEAEELLARASRGEQAGGEPLRAYRLATAWGTVLQQAGDLLGARERRERALEAAEAGGDTAALASALTNLAQTEIRLHDYASALDRLRRVLELEERPRNRTIALVETGICHLELNQLDEAERAFGEARDLARAAGNDPLEGWALGEQGLVEWERGRAEPALELFELAAASSRRAGDVRNEIVWWMNKGRLRRDQERWREALAFYREAERLEGSLPGQRPSANLRRQIGQCLVGLGRLEQAEVSFRDALAFAEGSGDTKVIWETRRDLARLYARTERDEEARRAWLEALDGIETIRGGLRLEALEADFFADKIEVYREAIAFLLSRRGPEAPASAFHVAERARARAFLGSLAESRAALHETVPSELVAEERRVLAVISRLQAQQRSGEPANAGAADLARAEAELLALELRVRAEHPRLSEMRGRAPADAAAVQQALAPGEVLLEYLLAEPESHLWVVERSRLRHFALPSASELERDVRRAYTELLDAASTPRLEELGRRLLGPAGPFEPAPSSLLIVPSGILHYLPFEALPLGEGHVVDRAATSYLPSASALVELRRRPVEPASPRLLAVGDATYAPAAAPAPLWGSGNLGALPYTRREVEELRARFGRGSSTLLLGRAAAEGRLKSEPLERYSVLHLAVHGRIDASDAGRSGLVLAPEPGGDDGILQFREILRMRLAADLVTLSACQSALGELVTGEGMVGLARAFFYAGSDSVVASLWNVADEASADLMAAFYSGLAQGLPKAEALRRARLTLREDPRYAHPYYWSPFVLIGRGEDGVEIPGDVPGPTALLALAGVTVAGLGLIAWRRRRGRSTAP